jgi:hypothetical protein
MRRPQFSLKTMLHAYAVGLVVAGLTIMATGVTLTAVSATSADVLVERVSPTMDKNEVRQVTFDFLESLHRRIQVILGAVCVSFRGCHSCTAPAEHLSLSRVVCIVRQCYWLAGPASRCDGLRRLHHGHRHRSLRDKPL